MENVIRPDESSAQKKEVLKVNLAEYARVMLQAIGDRHLEGTLKIDFGNGQFLYIDGRSAPAFISAEDKRADCTLLLTDKERGRGLECFDEVLQGKKDLDTMLLQNNLRVAGKNFGPLVNLCKVFSAPSASGALRKAA